MPLVLSIGSDLEALTRRLDAMTAKEIPFATVIALNGIANSVKMAETAGLQQVFNKPDRFTMSALAMRPATKSAPESMVFVKDRQAAYFEPAELGTPQFLGQKKRAMLMPVAVRTGGSKAPKIALNRLKGRAGVFVGHASVKAGGNAVGGVFQRMQFNKASDKTGKTIKGSYLKLMYKFYSPHDIKTHLEYRVRSERLIKASVQTEFTKALQKALDTAR